jgi:hypothetical protein
VVGLESFPQKRRGVELAHKYHRFAPTSDARGLRLVFRHREPGGKIFADHRPCRLDLTGAGMRDRERSPIDIQSGRIGECLLDERDEFMQASLMEAHGRELSSVDPHRVGLTRLDAEGQRGFGEAFEFGEVAA